MNSLRDAVNLARDILITRMGGIVERLSLEAGFHSENFQRTRGTSEEHIVAKPRHARSNSMIIEPNRQLPGIIRVAFFSFYLGHIDMMGLLQA